MNETIDYTNWARENFKKDIFAMEITGIEIEKALKGYALCKMEVTDKHYNANNFVMGGAIYTLADFCFAVASNCGCTDTVTVSLSSNIHYIKGAKAPLLIAETTCIKDGKTTCIYNTTVKDNLNNEIARVTTTGFKTQRK